MNFSRRILEILVLIIILILIGYDYSPFRQVKHFEYGVFYFETQGDFVVPLEDDAPAIYSWTSDSNKIKGDAGHLWRSLEINAPMVQTFEELEVSLLNQLSSKGWSLDVLQVTSFKASQDNIRTAYRYIFKKEL